MLSFSQNKQKKKLLSFGISTTEIAHIQPGFRNTAVTIVCTQHMKWQCSALRDILLLTAHPGIWLSLYTNDFLGQ
jgi:hypothetical protein